MVRNTYVPVIAPDAHHNSTGADVAALCTRVAVNRGTERVITYTTAPAPRDNFPVERHGIGPRRLVLIRTNAVVIVPSAPYIFPPCHLYNIFPV